MIVRSTLSTFLQSILSFFGFEVLVTSGDFASAWIRSISCLDPEALPEA